MRQDANEIKAFLQARNITTLCHFTDERNLSYILKFGLLSRQKLAQKGYKHYYNDEMRLDGAMDFISLSITNINHFLADCFIRQGKIQSCVVLELDANLLWRQFSRRLYCQTNAAASIATQNIFFIVFLSCFCAQISLRKGKYKAKILQKR